MEQIEIKMMGRIEVCGYDVVSALHEIFKSKKLYEVTLVINCPGGDVDIGASIIDLISACQEKGHKFKAIGQVVMSMASPIFIMCDYRILYPNTAMMIHKPYWEIDETEGKIKSRNKKMMTKELKRAYNLYVNTIANHCNLDKESIEDMMKIDYYLNATEVIRYSMCDEITVA